MKLSILRVLFLLHALSVFAFASNSVVNMSHYDLMRPDFVAMKSEGILGVIHEATYPRFDRDARYRERQVAATQVGLLWGAYHYGDATNPIRQADHFLGMVAASAPAPLGPGKRRQGVLLVLDFEKNGHYPGGTMTVAQAVAFVERIRERTGKYPGLYCSEYRLRQMLYGPGVTAAQRRRLGTAGSGSRITILSRATPPPGIDGTSGNTVEMGSAISRGACTQKVSRMFARRNAIFFAAITARYNSSGKKTPGFRPDRSRLSRRWPNFV